MATSKATRSVVLAGTFEPSFARNRVIAALLERAGFDVRTVQRSVWGSQRYVLIDAPKARLAARALRAYVSLAWALARAARPDLIVVLYPGYFDMPLVAAIARIRRIPVVFDIFISLHDTVTGDRAMRSSTSFAGRLTRLVDRLACRSADIVLTDTPEHASFYSSLTGLPIERFRTLWLGAQDDVFSPRPGIEPTSRLVTFHGTFIPLQGIDTIVRAAKLVEADGIRVRLIGDGQERSRIEQLVGMLGPSNLELVGALPLTDIPRAIAESALCLGIFGTTPKAGRVVPNKLFECLAVGRPVVTADTPAIRSAFDREVATVPAGDPTALADAMRELVEDPARLASLAEAGHDRYRRDYDEAALARLLSDHLTELLASR